LRLLPPVIRARDFHLYLDTPPNVPRSKSGPGKTRLVDLWLYGGKALLGHKPPNQLRELKNVLDRGLLAPFPHPQERRFIKALGALFPTTPGVRFRVYPDEAALQAALESAALEKVCLPTWRPFHPASSNLLPLTSYRLLVPHPLAPPVLLVDGRLDAALPSGGLVAPALLAVSTRAVYDLIAVVNRGAVCFRKVEAVLTRPDCPWRQAGIYLTYRDRPTPEAWAQIWKAFFAGGFLLPPTPDDPLILPALMSSGEESKLAALLL
jgi:hypothetical protein